MYRSRRLAQDRLEGSTVHNRSFQRADCDGLRLLSILIARHSAAHNLHNARWIPHFFLSKMVRGSLRTPEWLKTDLRILSCAADSIEGRYQSAFCHVRWRRCGCNQWVRYWMARGCFGSTRPHLLRGSRKRWAEFGIFSLTRFAESWHLEWAFLTKGRPNGGSRQ